MNPILGAEPWGSPVPPAVVVILLFGWAAMADRPDGEGSRRRRVRPFLETYCLLRGSGKTPREAREAMVRTLRPEDPDFVEAALRSFALALRLPERERGALVRMAVALSVLLEGEPSSLVDLRREMAAEVRGYRLPEPPVKSRSDASGDHDFDFYFDFDWD